ncbi:MAG: hypothetical protein WCD76_14985 [Pyrinomonadaceae bacterium]
MLIAHEESLSQKELAGEARDCLSTLAKVTNVEGKIFLTASQTERKLRLLTSSQFNIGVSANIVLIVAKRDTLMPFYSLNKLQTRIIPRVETKRLLF